MRDYFDISGIFETTEFEIAQVACISLKGDGLNKLFVTFVQILSYCISYEPPRGKTNNVVSEQVPHKPGCTVTEDG